MGIEEIPANEDVEMKSHDDESCDDYSDSDNNSSDDNAVIKNKHMDMDTNVGYI